MTFRLTERAELELNVIIAESAEHFGVAHAVSYVAGLRGKLALLADHPGLARAREELIGRARAYRYKAHMIVYREEGCDIVIIRLPHARSDWISEAD